jgi:uncharacterized protein (TIGR01319 family)
VNLGITLAIDFGSTNTKVVALDLDHEELIGVAQAPSTVGTDVTIGLRMALERLQNTSGVSYSGADNTVACSSAAGGLRIVAIGLVKQLTTKVAEEAALGAGAKIVGTFSYGLSQQDIPLIEQIAPDIILLTGGTDGGDEKTLLENAKVLAVSRIGSPIIIAGNRNVASKAETILSEAGKLVSVVPNVLPELDRTDIEPARSAIRNIFMRRIVQAKGLEKAQRMVGDIIMPTPMAVLQGSQLLAEGSGDETGLGDLMVVDVGGATTNVHSVASGMPSRPEVIVKGLPEPFAKRTVEGDLGIRYNARVILQIVGQKQLREKIALFMGTTLSPIDLESHTEYLTTHVSKVPESREESCVDMALAFTAIDVATRRHAGKIEEIYFPTGKAWIQHGKDLSKTKYIIGTGGILVYGQEPEKIIQAACFNPHNPESLRPLGADIYIDKRYILYSIGLLAQTSPVKALRIVKKHLERTG